MPHPRQLHGPAQARTVAGRQLVVAGGARFGQHDRVARIVVIEDHQDTADLMLEILVAAGHRVETAYTGRDGIETARRSQAQVVFCDVGLPDIDGYEVARALRTVPELAGARLIALTGFQGEEERQRAIAAGFDLHVVKPVDPEALEQLAIP
jgi:CheY-like chemotaxis protein